MARSCVSRGFRRVGLGQLWERLLRYYAFRSSQLANINRHGSQIIQIVGVPRSGTTLLAAMVGSHSKATSLIEPYLAWLQRGSFDFDFDSLAGQVKQEERSAFLQRLPPALMRRLCRTPGLQVIAFKETYRTERHPTFPSRRFLERNEEQQAVDHTLAIVRDPRDVWASVITRHPNLREDRDTREELLYAWNTLCSWIRDADLSFIRYEDLSSEPPRIESLLDIVGLDSEPSVFEPKKSPGHGDKRAQSGGEITSTSVGRYVDALEGTTIDEIEQRCSVHMSHFEYQPNSGELR